MNESSQILLPNVVPYVGLATAIAVGGTALAVLPANCYGGYIQNPLSAADQGLGSPEDLFVDPIQPPALVGYGSTTRLAPGDIWYVPFLKSTLAIWANAASSGHRFIAVYWIGP